MLEDDFVLLIAQVNQHALTALVDSIVRAVGEFTLTLAPSIEHLIHMSIAHKFLDKDIHFQGFKLRLAKKRIFILVLVVIGKKLLCEVVITRANFTAVVYVVPP